MAETTQPEHVSKTLETAEFFKCPKCERQFKRKDNYDVHVVECDGATKSNHGGARKGAGGTKGRKTQKVLDRMKAKQRILERITRNADKLYEAQFRLATGVQMLFVIKTDRKGNRLPAEQITDSETITAYLDGELEGLDDEYYFIATQKPDNKAIKDMLDRAFGKPTEKVDLTSGGRRIEQPKIISIIKPRGQAKDD